ncbi:MAG: mercury methylation corrinoid protein HgcA [Prolixibacteraceae bacterium]|jgi:hypothetical protein|nr:mercury methylation corrinoid protein HgcA [Prolixibacteraceae bacterium]
MNAIDFKQVQLDTEKLPIVRPTSSKWNGADYWGAFKVRWSVGRNTYSVPPGLYKLGDPSSNTPVMLTSNYKLSFDVLRRSLKGFDAWILVLDTKGVNVWCAAGKGTFGTQELIKRINQTELEKYVSYHKIIGPQLGAPGIAAHEVKKATGFKVEFGPVRASDMPDYIHNNFECTEPMRTVTFEIGDRLKLAPVEISNSIKYLLLLIVVFIGLSGITPTAYSIELIVPNGIKAIFILLVAYLAGAFFTPLFLPWLPSRMFSLKGVAMGIIGFSVLYLFKVIDFFWLQSLGWLFISISIASFLGMNFTGASTYTSLSGVKKEMAIFVPIQISMGVIGLITIIISKFIWL